MSELEVEQSKTHTQENFPVASMLIAPQYRAAILAYYRFVRGADDVVDNGALTSSQKLAGLDAFEAALLGRSDEIAAARPLRAILAEKNLSPRHALDVLRAFRKDAVKNRYASWDELMEYCAYSAAPVGRFVLDVHGESEATWPASDALCSALQVINHLQDCAADYRNLDRVYIPQDALDAQGIGVEALTAKKASPELRACINGLVAKTDALIDVGVGLPGGVRDFRLRLETAVIARLARRLNQLLGQRDPLSEKVHLGKPAFIGWTCVGVLSGLATVARRKAPAAIKQAGGA
ncbi:MAG: squalene synthase HpnC [Methylocella sp.]